MLLDVATDAVAVDEFRAATGWDIKPEGACQGPLCVPLPAGARRDDGRVDLSALADRLGMPVVTDAARNVAALGPATVSGRALSSVVAPELTLPDLLTGEPFRLSTLRGRKVVLVAWAPW